MFFPPRRTPGTCKLRLVLTIKVIPHIEDESISTDRERKIGVNRHGGDVIGDVTDGGLPLHIFDYVTSK